MAELRGFSLSTRLMSTTDVRLKARKLRLDAYCPDEPMNPAVNMDTYILMATRLSEQATACEAAGALARICPRTQVPRDDDR